MKHLIEKGIQTANKYGKRYSVSLASKVMQIKTVSYHNTLVRAVNFKIVDNSGKDAKNRVILLVLIQNGLAPLKTYLAVSFLVFKTGSHYVNTGLLQLVIFLPQPLKS